MQNGGANVYFISIFVQIPLDNACKVLAMECLHCLLELIPCKFVLRIQ